MMATEYSLRVPECNPAKCHHFIWPVRVRSSMRGRVFRRFHRATNATATNENTHPDIFH